MQWKTGLVAGQTLATLLIAFLDHKVERTKDVVKITTSTHPRKVVVAGPGTGNSYLLGLSGSTTMKYPVFHGKRLEEIESTVHDI